MFLKDVFKLPAERYEEVELYFDGTLRIRSCAYSFPVYLLHPVTERNVHGKFAARVDDLIRLRTRISKRGVIEWNETPSLNSNARIRIQYSKVGRTSAMVVNGNGRVSALWTVMQLFQIESVRFKAILSECTGKVIETEFPLSQSRKESAEAFCKYVAGSRLCRRCSS